MAAGDVVVKRRPGPFARRCHVAVFDRIEVDVIEVRFEIAFVADRVFPKAALPNATATFPRAGIGARGITVEPSPGQRLHLFNCHLAPYPYGPYAVKNGQSQAAVVELENETRLPALRLLLKAMQPYLDGPDPCFLTGDFNAPSHLDYTDLPWPTSVACVNAGLKDSYRELHAGNRQFPPAFAYQEPGITWTPKTAVEPEGVFDRIDFVYFSDDDGVAPVQSTELDGRNSVNPWPSDHRAVITTFALTPPEHGRLRARSVRAPAAPVR